ncbi:MAG: ABC transporter ATP-binding protein [Planctomycetota bacterium]
MTDIASPETTAPTFPPAPGAIGVRGLGHRFGPKVALEPLDLDVGPGGVVGLLGPNGSGKSTLMRLLVGLVRKEVGEVHVDGIQLEGDGVAVRRRVTYAPGELHLYGELTGGEQLSFLLRGRSSAEVRRARWIAGELGLPLERRVRGYSHGMKRQLTFAAAMAPEVRIRILDEISEGLDPAKRSEILDMIQEDAKCGTTILLSSHHLGEVDRSCDRLVFLSAGQLIADETAQSVREHASRLVRLTFPEDSITEAEVGLALAGDGVESVRADGSEVAVLLDSDDPRKFLLRLASSSELPAPTSIEHGRISLRELYKALYGVEGT